MLGNILQSLANGAIGMLVGLTLSIMVMLNIIVVREYWWGALVRVFEALFLVGC